MVPKKPPDKLVPQAEARNAMRGDDIKNSTKTKTKTKTAKSSTALEKLNESTRERKDINQHETPQMQSKSPARKTFNASPNYMKPTSSWDARKQHLQVKTHSPATTDKNINSALSKPAAPPSSPMNCSPRYAKRLSRKASSRSRRPSMKKSIVISLSQKENLNRATCSSIFKESKFRKALDLDPGASEAERNSIMKVCPFNYCSLNGHKHEPSTPLKRFLSLRRRSVKTQMSMKVKKQASFRRRTFRKGRKETDARKSFVNRGMTSSTKCSHGDVLVENYAEPYEIMNIEMDKEIFRLLRTLSSKEDYFASSDEEDEENEGTVALNKISETYSTISSEDDLYQSSDIFPKATDADMNFLNSETEENLPKIMQVNHDGWGLECCGVDVLESRKEYLTESDDTIIIEATDQIEDSGYFSDGSIVVLDIIEGKKKKIQDELLLASESTLITEEHGQSAKRGDYLALEGSQSEYYEDDSSYGEERKAIKELFNYSASESDMLDNPMQNTIIIDFEYQDSLEAKEPGDRQVVTEDNISLNSNEEIKVLISSNVEASYVNDHPTQNVPIEVLEQEGSLETKEIVDRLVFTEENVPLNSNEEIGVLCDVKVSDMPDDRNLNIMGDVLDIEGLSQAKELLDDWVVIDENVPISANEEIEVLLSCNVEAYVMPAHSNESTVIDALEQQFSSKAKDLGDSVVMIKESIPFTNNEENEVPVSCSVRGSDMPDNTVHNALTDVSKQQGSSEAEAMGYKLMLVEDSTAQGSNRVISGPMKGTSEELEYLSLGKDDYNATGTSKVEAYAAIECEEIERTTNLENLDNVRLNNANEGDKSAYGTAEDDNINGALENEKSESVDLEEYDLITGYGNTDHTNINIDTEDDVTGDDKTEKENHSIMEMEIYESHYGVYTIKEDNPEIDNVQSELQIEVDDSTEDSGILLKFYDYTYDTQSDESSYENQEFKDDEQENNESYYLEEYFLEANGDPEKHILICYDAARSEITLSSTTDNKKAKYTIAQRRNSSHEVDGIEVVNRRAPHFLPVNLDPETEKVDLRHQTMDERKNAKEWMMDYALQQLVHKLAPARKRKVALLVKAFDAVLPPAVGPQDLLKPAANGLPN